MSDNYSHKIFVPMESVYSYMNSLQYGWCKSLIEAHASNVGKKANYKKFAKRMKKAVKYLPKGIEVVVRAERSER